MTESNNPKKTTMMAADIEPMKILCATYRIITPVFCAGHDQNGPSEIRPFSLRGATRFWYRTVDPDFRRSEGLYFGSSAGERGQSSPMVLLVTRNLVEQKDFSKDFRPRRDIESGLAYLGYSLYMGPNKRKGISPDMEFSIEVSPQPGAMPGAQESSNTKKEKTRNLEKARRGWAAGLWLLGHLGGLGSRSRRAIGTISLQSWTGWPECDSLPPIGHPNEPREWKNSLIKGLKTIENWFPGTWPEPHDHPVLKDPEKHIAIIQEPHRDWRGAMDQAGILYKGYRKQYKSNKNASFGLPLKKFETNKRAASRLHIRILELGKAYYPLFIALQGPAWPENLIRHQDLGLPDVFIDELKRKKGGL